MQILLIHPEDTFFAGAETMLKYFVGGISSSGVNLTIALSRGSRLDKELPSHVKRVFLPDNRPFSPYVLYRQLRIITARDRQTTFDLFHGWSARDWELTSLVAWRLRRHGVGTLHDHPRARFITPTRQRLMRLGARYGLSRVVCVSNAVREECLSSGIAERKLITIHNGIPEGREARITGDRSENLRLGFLGGFSERKGLRTLFQIVERLPKILGDKWELAMAGDAQDETGAALVAELREMYSHRPWWGRIHWLGWVAQPDQFLKSLDLLICPSTEFDPFPTVLLEAGAAGIPVLASRIGGVSEIVNPGLTGWLFRPGDPADGAETLSRILPDPSILLRAGEAAQLRVKNSFSIQRMVASYFSLYDEVARSV